MDFLSHLSIQNLFFILAGLGGIGFLIGFHELGHFLFCKLFKISTPTFSIGFGPRLFSRKIGSTEFSLSAIPLGGYVEIAGAAEVGQGEQKEASRDDEYSFARKPYYQKLLVMVGGIACNLIFAYVALICIVMLGTPETTLLYPMNATPTIKMVEPDSAAAKSQSLKPGNTLYKIDTIEIGNNLRPALDYIASNPGREVDVSVIMDGDMIVSEKITIGSRKHGNRERGALGIAFESRELPRSTFSEAVKSGFSLTNAYIKAIFNGFASLLKDRNFSQMGGPLQIISILSMKGAAAGAKIFFIFLSIISINLAILNLIPLPILDGGQILFYTIEAIIRRPLPIKMKEYIHIASWLLMLTLILYLSTKDIMRLFNIG